jgi:hypothetical protein
MRSEWLAINPVLEGYKEEKKFTSLALILNY